MNILSSAILRPFLRRNEENVFANTSPGMPAVCSVCQLPAEFPNPDSPLELMDTVQRI